MLHTPLPSQQFANGIYIRFKEAELRLVPVLEGTDRDLLFEQRAWSGRRESMWRLFPHRTQQPICCRRAQGEELRAAQIAALVGKREGAIQKLLSRIITHLRALYESQQKGANDA